MNDSALCEVQLGRSANLASCSQQISNARTIGQQLHPIDGTPEDASWMNPENQ
eukprot:COSAG03_NODE_11617_length_584_cov_0.567010_1_plen_52_part_10